MNRYFYLKPAVLFLYLVFALKSDAQQPVMEWARQMGGLNEDIGTAICSDAQGNVYTTGCFYGNVDFDPGPDTATLTANGQFDIFISKLDASGNFLWTKQIGVRGVNKGYGIKADADGYVYVVGQFEGSPDFNPGQGVNRLTAFNGRMDAFILKLDSLGGYVWAQNLGILGSSGGTGYNIAYGMALDSAGNVYVTGEADNDAFVSKLDNSGNFLWTRTMGGNRSEYSFAVDVDDLGNVYTTGHFSSDTADFDPGVGTYNLFNAAPSQSSYSYDVFLSKLDSSGNFVWARSIGGSSADMGRGVVVDPAGYVYTSGYFRGTINANSVGTPYYMTSFGLGDAFICKFKTSGDFVWAKQMGGTTTTECFGLALDYNRSVYAIGSFHGRVDFNPASGASDTFFLNTKTGSDIYISKLDSSGNFVWAKSFSDQSNFNYANYGFGITTDVNKTVYAVGAFRGDVIFDTSINNARFQSSGDLDIFLVKINQFCLDTSFVQLKQSVCEDSYTFNGETYNASGTYTQTFINKAGCDSTVTLNLTLSPIQHPLISVDSFVLSSTFQYESYQWMLNGNLISGATDSFLNVTENGAYRLIVKNENGCTDTSDVYDVTNFTAIKNVTWSSDPIDIYPNPAQGMLHIESRIPVRVLITTMEGKHIKNVKEAKQIPVQDLAEGIYLLHISDMQGRLLKVEKIVKQ